MTDKQILGCIFGLAVVGTSVYIFYPKGKKPTGVNGNPPPIACFDVNASNHGAIGTCSCKPGYSMSNGKCTPTPPPSVCTDPNAKNNGGALPCICKDGYGRVNGVCTGATGGPNYIGTTKGNMKTKWNNNILFGV